jgi:hypothetical protein
MNKNQIHKTLASEGITARYSGKSKTFYLSKKPSTEISNSIKESGFKVK